VLIFFYPYIFVHFVWYFFQSFCCKLSFHLLILFDILHQTKYFFIAYYFSGASVIPFSFFSIIHLYLPPLFSILYICCYLLDEFFFYFFVFILPISHTFISLSLVFLLLLIFNLILALTKKSSDSMSSPHLLLKSETFVQ
jgi:hypothetical protein